MKFPKSVHAEGWAKHIDTAPGALSDTLKPAAPRLRGARTSAGAMRMDSQRPVPPLLSTTPTMAPPMRPRMAAADTRPQQRAAAQPPQRQSQLSWMIAAGAGAAVIAAVAVWSMNRPAEAPVAVTGSVAPQAEIAVAAPVPDSALAAAPVEEPATALVAATPAEPAPARPAPSLTTVKPVVEARPLAQAAAPAPRPDLVQRANPRSAALQPLPAQLAPATLAAAPAEPPLAIQPGTAAQTPPPTAAEAAASATSPGTPPLAQAALPVAEDARITVQVRSALASDATLAAVPIAVSTAQGVVKLEGQAPDAPTRERATVVASSAAGVKAVDNRLTLAPTPLLSQAPNGL
jgi:BON domain